MSFYTNVQNVKGQIFYRGIDDKGRHFKQKVDYNPSLFIPSAKESKWKTLEGENVSEVPCGSINEARDFIRKYEGVDNFKIYGNTNFHYCFIADNFPNDIYYDINQISIANIDIETGSENGFPDPQIASEEVISITVKVKGKFYSFGCGEYTPSDENVTYVRCSNEIHMLQEFLSFWEKLDVDIVTGWNVKFFDIPFLVNRMNRLFDKPEYQRLSPWKFVSERTVNQMGFGGKGANQAVMAGLLGAEVYMICCLGSDVYKDMTIDNFKINGVATDYIQIVEGSSGVAPIWVDKTGQNRIIVIPGANNLISGSKAIDSLKIIGNVDVVVGQFEIPMEVNEAVFSYAFENGITTVLNPAPADKPSDSLLENTSWFIPNEVEFEEIFGKTFNEQNLLSFAKELQTNVVVTLGEKGCAYVEDNSVTMFETESVNTIDTTCLLYTSPSPRDQRGSRMPASA